MPYQRKNPEVSVLWHPLYANIIRLQTRSCKVTTDKRAFRSKTSHKKKKKKTFLTIATGERSCIFQVWFQRYLIIPLTCLMPCLLVILTLQVNFSQINWRDRGLWEYQSSASFLEIGSRQGNKYQKVPTKGRQSGEGVRLPKQQQAEFI